MSIFYITGKPGGGKTYIAIAQICEELKSGKGRYIVTNIALNMKELAQWCHDNIKEEVNLAERIRILDDSETGEFWLYEPHIKYNQRRVLEFGKRSMEVPDFEDRGMPGTLYVIDEVHIYFGARDWQATGSDCTYFLSQHRKMGCDVVLVTQHPEQTDKALRRLAQEYMVVRNLSREPIFGFRIANFFRFTRNLNSPLSPNPGTFETGFVKLRPEEYGKLYDTTAGVGIAGRLSPQNEVRGWHWAWLLIPVCSVVVFFAWLFTHLSTVSLFMHNQFNKAFFHVTQQAMQHPFIHVNKPALVSHAMSMPGVQNNTFVSQNLSSGPILPAITKVSFETTNTVYCTGYCVLPGRALVFLSDGRIAEQFAGEVQEIHSHRVKVFGEWYDVHTTAQIASEARSTLVSGPVYQGANNFAGGSKNEDAADLGALMGGGVIAMRSSGILSSKPYVPHARPITFGQGSNPSQQSSPYSSSAFPSPGDP